MNNRMDEYLATSAWQLCDHKSGICFGMVGGIVRLRRDVAMSGDVIIRLLLDRSKARITDNDEEFVIRLPEAWARALADEMSNVLIRSDHLHRLYWQGQLTPYAVYQADAGLPEAESEQPSVRSVKLPISPTALEMTPEMQTETLILRLQNRTEAGSVLAFGPTKSSGTVQIRLWKAAIPQVLTEDEIVDIEIAKSSAEDISQRVREAEVQLKNLRGLKKFSESIE